MNTFDVFVLLRTSFNKAKTKFVNKGRNVEDQQCCLPVLKPNHELLV